MEQVLNPEFIKYIGLYLTPAVTITGAVIYGLVKIAPVIPAIMKAKADIINAEANMKEVEGKYGEDGEQDK